jgi:hypothetical protein
MSEPDRLIHRSGLASALLRAGSDERPSNARLRRAISTLGAAAAVSSLTAEAAGGGASAIASGALGSALAKTGAGSASVILAVKWLAIGSLGALVAVGATQIGSRVRAPIEAPVAPRTSESSARAPRVSPSWPAPDHPEIRSEVVGFPTAPAPGVEVAARPSVEPFGSGPRTFGDPVVRTAPLPVSRTGVDPATDPARPHAGEGRPSGGVALGQRAPSAPMASPSDAPSLEIAPALTESAPPPARNTSPEQVQLRLAREVSLVDRAWTAMKRRDFSRALAELAGYEEEFPDLGLHPEVLFVRMEAEDGLGRVAAARFQASRILASYPKSAQAGRARAVLSRR